jgi:transglutaminase-like putative cysteine protease
MLRTALLSGLAGLVIAIDWLRLEEPRHEASRLAALVAVAIVPALLPRGRLRAAGTVVAAVGGLGIAFSVSPRALWPDGAGFFGPVASRFADGFADFYEFRLPIDPGAHEHMHMVLLAAAFVFALAVALGVAARRVLLAVVVFLVGAGWPATLLAGGDELGRGLLILVAALALMAGLSNRAVRFALPAAVAVVLGSLALSSSPAVAKSAFLDWQSWNPYRHADKPVSVEFVWNSRYDGIRFPRKATTVFTVDAPATIGTYWRATVLDSFAGDRWVERLWRESVVQRRELEAPGARNLAHAVRQDVTIEGLRDKHLVAGSIPIAYSSSEPAAYAGQSVALAPRGLHRGERYVALSFVPDPKPEALVHSRPVYPAVLTRPGRELEIAPRVNSPPFGTPGRDERLAHALTGRLAPYVQLLHRARAVAGATRSPYAATVALERWLRTTGGFIYSTQPPGTPGVPPLVGFVLETKSGYCQHFAGGMALMLRLLGIPARVAAGFVTGRHAGGTWTVTDHDAHTWVEAWFRGYGWLPFDPTPGRGRLAASYSAASRSFDAVAEAKLLSGLVRGGEVFGGGKKGSAVEKRGPSLLIGAESARRKGQAAPEGPQRHSLVGFLTLLALGLVGAIAVAKLLRRRLRYLTRDPRRIASACGRELSDFLLDQRVPLQPASTFRELSAALSERFGVDARTFADSAEAARFGHDTTAPEAARRARHELRDLKARLRRRLLARQRARGLVSLRSLGFS